MRRNPDNPSTTFFWNDWDNEPGMRFCTLAAQGLWLKMLSLAARSAEYGVVLVGEHPSRRADLPTLLAPSCGETPDTINKLIEMLVTFKVASIDDQGKVINRRMVAEARLSAARAAAGGRGAAVTNGRRQKFGKGVGKPVGKTRDTVVGKIGGDEQAEKIDRSMTNPNAATDGARQDSGKLSGKSSGSSFFILSSVSKDTGAEAPAGSVSDLSPVQYIFGPALAWLLKTTGKSNDSCRKILGDWRAQFSDDLALVAAIKTATERGIGHPESWMAAAIKARKPKRSIRSAWAEALP